MLLLISRITLAIVLALVVQCVDGNQKIVHISELFSDTDDGDTVTNSADGSGLLCCKYENISHYSFDDALYNLTSNVLLNITTDVILSSLIKLFHLENISIIGHNNPTVNCKGVGGIQFTFCNNCVFQGITWDGCGTDNIDITVEPGLKLSYSSNITIQNCKFQHFIGQAVVLLNISGDVNINNCKFVNNSHYRGHGAAISYLSVNTINYPPLLFKISNCNFTHNEGAESFVYIKNRTPGHNNGVNIICDSEFSHNQGVSICVANQKLYLNGKNLFQHNKAKNGTGIYISSHSTVTFGRNSDVAFIQNSAHHNGGAIFSHGNLYFTDHSTTVFNSNTAGFYGGGIFSHGHIFFTHNATTQFINNNAEYGGAILSNVYIIFTHHATTVFNNNNAGYHGGAIFSYGRLFFTHRATTVFNNNNARLSGGAINKGHNTPICFEDNSTTRFSNNKAVTGGAIMIHLNTNIHFKDNSTTEFSNNNANSWGGAIAAWGDNQNFIHSELTMRPITLSASIYFEDNSTTVFINNTAECGGVICSNSNILFKDNSTVEFSNNADDDEAIILDHFNSRALDRHLTNAKIISSGNVSVIFNDQPAKWCANTCLPYTGQGEVVIDSNGVAWCSDQSSFICEGRNCYCTDIGSVLGNAENSSLATITFSNKAVLSSVIELKVLQNKFIMGLNNLTVTCVNGGRLYIEYCNNLTIEGVSWIGCGVLTINHSRDITIQKCSFQHSLGQAVKLSGVLGDVNINHCKFMNNNHYRGHGTALYYSSNNPSNVFTITNCDFSFNRYSKSVVYIKQSLRHMHVNNSVFYSNQGVSIYLSSYDNLYMDGEILFENNVAEYGAGIFINDHSTVTFGENCKVKFINNIANHSGAAVLLNNHSSILFDKNSIAMFNDNKATNGTIYSRDNCNVTFKATCVVTFSRNAVTLYGAAIHSLDSCHVTFTGNSNVKFSNNIIPSANKKYLQIGGTIFSLTHSRVSFEGNSTIIFSNNVADYGTAICLYYNSSVTSKGTSSITFDNNSVRYCGTLVSYLFSSVSFNENVTATYNGNKMSCTSNDCYETSASGICTFLRSNVVFSGYSLVTFINNTGSGGGAVVFSESTVLTEEFSTVIFYNNTAQYSSGGALLCSNNSIITIAGNSNVMFNGNKAGQNGGAIHSYNMCKITFKDNSNSTFVNNTARINGGAILTGKVSEIAFKGNSTVYLDRNTANNGGAFYCTNSTIISTEASVVTFSDNKAKQNAGVGYLTLASKVVFEGTTVIMFHSNMAKECAGVLCSVRSTIQFKENSNITFMFNKALNGGAISATGHSDVTIRGNSILLFVSNEAIQNGGSLYLSESTSTTVSESSSVTFNDNSARGNGGVIHLLNSILLFKGNTIVSLTNNEAMLHGGAMCVADKSDVSFSQFTNITFYNNRAVYGGAILAIECSSIKSTGSSVLSFQSNTASIGGAVSVFNVGNSTLKCYSSFNIMALDSGITFMGRSKVAFGYNMADNGGTFYIVNSTMIAFKEHSVIMFNNNKARQSGGVFYFVNSILSFKENSTVSLSYNEATLNGGAMYFSTNSNITFSQSSNVTFNNNKARQSGGVFYSVNSILLLFKDNSTVSMSYNEAILNGGAIHFSTNSDISFSQSSNVTFINNKATLGGAVSLINNSTMLFDDYASVTFLQNKATTYGGAAYFNVHCNVALSNYAKVLFESNNAQYGGAVCIINNGSITFKENSTVSFRNNMATADGGAMNIFINSRIMVKDYTKITFTENSAQYGGAMFFDVTYCTLVYNNHEGSINFIKNSARIAGKSVYFDLSRSCNKSCLNSRIIGMKNASKQFIATPPNKLQFYKPATCIDDGKTQCDTYYVNHVMLGQEIDIPACVLDYYDQPADQTQFHLYNRVHDNYTLSESNQILLSCDVPWGISVIGNKILSKSLNYSVNIVLHDDRNSNWKPISVNLKFELTSCYPGFWQYPTSQKCKCYNASDIVLCSNSVSTIKRGYWFGTVTGKPTVTLCPINYCNFTCCETSNGYYHLSPVRDNQCRSHRSGTACGSCTHGYTLSFDSPKCVAVQNCTAGHMVLVILLTVTYWIAMITLVFAMMYYKVRIGYLYSITYYYSIVDILLSQNLYASRELYFTVSIMSSFSKITPQFLGELCLATGMSGIDQQFIHYIHPSVVIIILVMICLIARRSRKFSTIIGRGAIHTICCLLLLSYTSMASTSLLLLRPLKFLDVDKVYTNLSPDIEYFHGRHLAYGIVALLCTVSIAIGLPLLLTLEPFLNHKINFIKIKPLLDQFQGCYKDKYRCFAGYYMICRLVIISIVIANSSNDFVANYVFIIVCGIIALIHVMVKPYNNEIINKFDSVILHLIIFIALLPWLDDFDSPFVIAMALTLMILPLLNFISVSIFLHKDDLKKMITHCTTKDELPSNNIDVSNNETPKKEFHLIIDDNMRKNAIICDV